MRCWLWMCPNALSWWLLRSPWWHSWLNVVSLWLPTMIAELVDLVMLSSGVHEPSHMSEVLFKRVRSQVIQSLRRTWRFEIRLATLAGCRACAFPLWARYSARHNQPIDEVVVCLSSWVSRIPVGSHASRGIESDVEVYHPSSNWLSLYEFANLIIAPKFHPTASFWNLCNALSIACSRIRSQFECHHLLLYPPSTTE